MHCPFFERTGSLDHGARTVDTIAQSWAGCLVYALLLCMLTSTKGNTHQANRWWRLHANEAISDDNRHLSFEIGRSGCWCRLSGAVWSPAADSAENFIRTTFMSLKPFALNIIQWWWDDTCTLKNLHSARTRNWYIKLPNYISMTLSNLSGQRHWPFPGMLRNNYECTTVHS